MVGGGVGQSFAVFISSRLAFSFTGIFTKTKLYYLKVCAHD